MGMDVYSRVTALIFLAVVILVPLQTFDQTCSELKVGDWDMMYATPMSANKIISGKIKSAFVIGSLFLSVCLPFIFMAVLLRGVDYLDAASMLLSAFISLFVFAEWAILLGCLQLPRWGRIICGLMGLFFGLIAIAAFGTGGGIVGMALLAFLVGFFSHVMSCAVIQPNRRPSYRPTV